jgi:hypothetical protein
MDIAATFISVVSYLIKPLNMAMVRNFEVMLGQTLNHYVEFCSFVQCLSFKRTFLQKDDEASEYVEVYLQLTMSSRTAAYIGKHEQLNHVYQCRTKNHVDLAPI